MTRSNRLMMMLRREGENVKKENWVFFSLFSLKGVRSTGLVVANRNFVN